jgi:hypothetical protein
MTKKFMSELYAEAGFGPGEVEKSRNLRAAFCTGTATPGQLAEYAQYSDKWNEYSRLTIEQDQAEALERQAPSPGRHDADPDGGLGSAMRQLRNNQPPPRTVVRTRLVQVDMGEGGLQNIPEAQSLPLYRGSADATGHRIIAAGLSANTKR